MSKLPELNVGKLLNRCAYHKKNSLRFLPYFSVRPNCNPRPGWYLPFFKQKKIAFPYQIYGYDKDFWVFRQKYFFAHLAVTLFVFVEQFLICVYIVAHVTY